MQIHSMKIRQSMAIIYIPNDECYVDFTDVPDSPDSPIAVTSETNDMLPMAAVQVEINKLQKFLQNPKIPSLLVEHIHDSLRQINLYCSRV